MALDDLAGRAASSLGKKAAGQGAKKAAGEGAKKAVGQGAKKAAGEGAKKAAASATTAAGEKAAGAGASGLGKTASGAPSPQTLAWGKAPGTEAADAGAGETPEAGKSFSGLDAARLAGKAMPKKAAPAAAPGAVSPEHDQSQAEGEMVGELKDNAREIGNEAKGIAADVAIGAASGAVAGAAAGGVGAAPGAVIGGLKGLGKGVAKSKKIRTGAIACLLITFLFSPLGLLTVGGGAMIASLSNDDAAQETASDDSSSASGVVPDVAQAAVSAARSVVIPRELISATHHIQNGGTFHAAANTGSDGTDGGSGGSYEVPDGVNVDECSRLTGEKGLKANAMNGFRAACHGFEKVETIGGVRNDPGSDHHTGHAIDVMINPGGEEDHALGDAVADFFLENRGEFNVKYVIWKQRIYNFQRSNPDWRDMEDRGSRTANHFDHVHVSFNDGECSGDCEGAESDGGGSGDDSGGQGGSGGSGGQGGSGGGEEVKGVSAEGVGPYKIDMDQVEALHEKDSTFPLLTEEEAEDLEFSSTYIGGLLRRSVPADIAGQKLTTGTGSTNIGGGKQVRSANQPNPNSDHSGSKPTVDHIEDAWVEALKNLPIGSAEENAEPIFRLARFWAWGVPNSEPDCSVLPSANNDSWTNPLVGVQVGPAFGDEFGDSGIEQVDDEAEEHLGLDYLLTDDEIKAPSDGEVTKATKSRVVIDHDNQVQTVVDLIDEVEVEEGDEVSAGDVIGTAATGDFDEEFDAPNDDEEELPEDEDAHGVAHIQINEGDDATDPEKFLSQRGVELGTGDKNNGSGSGGNSGGGSGGQRAVAAFENLGDGLKATDGNGNEVTITQEGLENASLVIGVGQEAGVTEDGVKSAILTTLVETGGELTHVVSATGKFVGIFQQSPDWGTTEEREDVSRSAAAYFGGPDGPNKGNPRGLLDIDGWEDMTVIDMAAKVQGIDPGHGSAGDPNWRPAADKWMPVAEAIMGQVDGTFSPVNCEGSSGGGFNGERADQKEWGGHSNGKIPDSQLCEVTVGTIQAGDPRLRCDAAEQYDLMAAAYKKDTGQEMVLTSAYRSYEDQVRVKRERGGLAAKPGTSTHGWALAVDISVGGRTNWNSPVYKWLVDNAETYGFEHPSWAQAGGSLPEAWHWEFFGKWHGD